MTPTFHAWLRSRTADPTKIPGHVPDLRGFRDIAAVARAVLADPGWPRRARDLGTVLRHVSGAPGAPPELALRFCWERFKAPFADEPPPAPRAPEPVHRGYLLGPDTIGRVREIAEHLTADGKRVSQGKAVDWAVERAWRQLKLDRATAPAS